MQIAQGVINVQSIVPVNGEELLSRILLEGVPFIEKEASLAETM